MRLDELTSADVSQMRRKPVVLLPVGAIEQHGPHLPLGAWIDRHVEDAVVGIVRAASRRRV